MKKLFYLLYFMVFFVSPSALSKSIQVHAYTKKDGTYVAPHYRTSPDSNFYNNWSTKGNINPYTGKKGNLLQPNENNIINYRTENHNPMTENEQAEILFDKSIK